MNVAQRLTRCQTPGIRASPVSAVAACTAAAALALLALAGPAADTGAAPAEGVAGSRPGFGPGPGVRCPRGEVVPVRADDDVSALAAARAFASAWFENDGSGAVALADPAFRASAARLAAGQPQGARAFQVGSATGLGHTPVGTRIARRCGPDVLTAMRLVEVELRGSGLGATLLLVLREPGWRVLAVV
jgi:hypothetical protein